MEITIPGTTNYDPTIFGLLSQCESDWGKPEDNRENLLPYGIKELDLALYGLDIRNGELVFILGAEKQRKTTLALNIVANYMTSSKPVEKPFTVVDTLESGMNPKRYRDSLISIMATRYLVSIGHKPHGQCHLCGNGECREMGISPEFLVYNTRTKTQQTAINYALDTMRWWPLHIYGANPTQGNTRDLYGTTRVRWERLITEYGAKVFVTDHVQQYTFSGEPTDYEKQLRAVQIHGELVAMYGIVDITLSQVSLGSLREVNNNGGQLYAAGGKKGQEESSNVLSVAYKSGSGKMKITVEESRRAATFSIVQTLDDVSGSFYGDTLSNLSQNPY